MVQQIFKVSRFLLRKINCRYIYKGRSKKGEEYEIRLDAVFTRFETAFDRILFRCKLFDILEIIGV